MTPEQYLLGAIGGGFVGLSLGLIGGGGSVLGVPLMVFVVGVNDPHIAIGTSAFAVAINACASLLNHARAGNVRWRCGGVFASAGVVGALLGSALGKSFDGHRLLFLFALVMIAIGALMLRDRGKLGETGVQCTVEKIPKVLAYGLVTGLFSGFFGIGGGFLIVPGLIGSTGMCMIDAVGTSLVAVAAFGFTTAANYAVSGLVDWRLAGVFILGGLAGSAAGARLARHLAQQTGRLAVVFAAIVFAVAAYMLFRTWSAW